jgi:hypothetical protein
MNKLRRVRNRVDAGATRAFGADTLSCRRTNRGQRAGVKPQNPVADQAIAEVVGVRSPQPICSASMTMIPSGPRT